MTHAWLDVMSWNVLADAYVRREYYPRTDAAWLAPGARTAAIVARIAERDVDVACLQEVEPPLVDALEHAFGASHVVRYAKKRGGRPDGVAVLVRRGLDAGDGHTLAFADGRGAAPSGHVALIARVRARGGGQVATIACTHLRWDPPATRREHRWAVAQADELIAVMHGAPEGWILCGDLNLDGDDPVLASFAAAGLADAYAGAASPTANPNGRAKRIDYILHGAAFAAAPSPVAPIDDLTPLPSAGEPSDHVAIGARLTWRSA